MSYKISKEYEITSDGKVMEVATNYFESRNCKNCKYFLNKMSAQWCTKKGNPMIFIYNSKATTFNCSEWEVKYD